MRLLVVGANGLLGSNVVRSGRRRDWAISGTYHSTRPSFDIQLTKFDLQDHDEFGDVIDTHEPDIVVNCAAMTDVDTCETNPEEAYILNSKAPGEIAAQCEINGINFVHVSTDYVFDGTIQDPYKESVDPNPMQMYGKSKRAGERAVQDELGMTLIPRLSFVWGIHRSTGEVTGFPSWVHSQLRSGETVPLFTDQWITPTRGEQAAETILDLIQQEATGLYHIACTSCVTPYEFGEMIAEYAGDSSDLLLKGSMDDIDRDARRPTYSCLDVSKVQSDLGRPQPTLREDVESVFNDLD